MPLVGLFTTPMRNRDRYSLHPPTLRDLTVVQYVVCTCTCTHAQLLIFWKQSINQVMHVCSMLIKFVLLVLYKVDVKDEK